MDDMEDLKLLTTEALVERNKRKLQELAEEELEFRQKAEEYLTVPPDEYFRVLNELYFQQKMTQIEQQKLLKEYQKRKLSSENKKLATSSKPTVVMKAQQGWTATIRCLNDFFKSRKLRKYLGCRMLRTCGFFTESFVFICYRKTCFLLTFFGIIGIFWNYFECVELQVIFPTEKSLKNARYLGLGGFASILIASLLGHAAERWKHVRIFGLLFWLIGWPLFAASIYLECEVAYGAELETKMNLEVQSYVNNPGSSLRAFMTDVQEGFECCGTHGPEGYGYRRNKLESDEKFLFPLSCCRTASYRFHSERNKECALYRKFDDSPLMSNLNAFVNKDGCHDRLQMYFQELNQNKFLVHWVAVVSFGMSVLVLICLLKIWIRKRRLLHQNPFLTPHESRRLSNIDEVINHLKLKSNSGVQGKTVNEHTS